MYIGIDVGGTFTDAILLDNALEPVAAAKIPTAQHDLLTCVTAALDAVMSSGNIKRQNINRLVLSTTLITNLIAQRKLEPVAMILIPGPGVNPAQYHFDVDFFVISGAIDYRGREIAPLKIAEILEAMHEIVRRNIRKVAVVGKFSPRNPNHEKAVESLIHREFPEIEVLTGHLVSGRLNFPRRAATTFLTLGTRARYEEFLHEIQNALRERNITAPAYILKADGGTMPIQASLKAPVETILSGPAASVTGALALTPPGETSVVVDIGGTTTDLALILNGVPLLASKGARIAGFLTQVRAYAVHSVPVGGDTAIKAEQGRLILSGERQGPAACLGGPQPTPTDAMRLLGLTSIGDVELARKAVSPLADQAGLNLEAAAEQILEETVQKIAEAINHMFRQWELEPAYRVWEILQGRKVRPQNIVGIGGAAPVLIPLLAQKMGCRPIVPEMAPVANALGAALARPTLTATLRADTELGTYTIEEAGVHDRLPGGRSFSGPDARELAGTWLKKMASQAGIEEYADQAEVLHEEVFNVVQGWTTKGKIYDVSIQITPGIIGRPGQRLDKEGDVYGR